MRTSAVFAALLACWLTPVVRSAQPLDLAKLVRDQIAQTGNVALPQGYYEFDTPVVIRDKVGVEIDGQGAVSHAEDYKWNTWNHPNNMRGTWLTYTGPPELAAITIDSCQHIKITDLSLACANGGTGIHYRTGRGGGNNHHTLASMRVFTKGDAILTGGGEKPFNSADMHFWDSIFVDCRSILHTQDAQNVGYHFFGCYSYGCTDWAYLEKGGNVYIFGGGANGLQRSIFHVELLGPNIGPNVLIGGRFDRSKRGDPIPYAVYAPNAPYSTSMFDFTGLMIASLPEDRTAEPVDLVVYPEAKDARVIVTARSTQKPRRAVWNGSARDLDRMVREVRAAMDALAEDPEATGEAKAKATEFLEAVRDDP